MWLPREPQPGQRLEASWGAGVIRYLRSNTLLSGVNYTAERTANGTTLRPRSTRAKAAETPFNWHVLTAGLTVAGVVPTDAEIQTALSSAYDAVNPGDPNTTPKDGDLVILSAGGTPKFQALVTTTALAGSTTFSISFVVNVGEDATPTAFYAILTQLGLY